MFDPSKENPPDDAILIKEPLRDRLNERIRRMLRPQRILFSLLFLVAAFAIVFACSRRAVYSQIPDLDKMSFPALQKIAMSKLESKVQWVPLKDIPKEVRYAVIYSEDASFFQHEGIDFDAISQSIQENIKRKKYAFGASTITQQVVKNVFLSKEKTLTRKFREMILARRIEERFTKAQILEVYFNIVELGPKIYGIGAAAQRYFGKFASQLNAAEGSFFAILLPSPVKRFKSIFLKGEIPKVFRAQVRRILADLEHTGVITAEQHLDYTNYDFFFVRRQEPDWTGPRDQILPDNDELFDDSEELEEEDEEKVDPSPKPEPKAAPDEPQEATLDASE